MALRSRRNNRRAKPIELGFTLLVLGAGIAIAPLFMQSSVFGKALTSLAPVGWLMLAAGALVVWLGSRKTVQADVPETSSGPGRTKAPVPRNAEIIDLPSRAEPTLGSHPQVPSRWGREVFEVIEWRRFEAVVERLFGQAGFETQSKSHGADGGVDVWLHSRHTPGQPVSVVQCKHWQGKRVGVDKIRELRGVMAAHNVKRGQFATTSTFTADAEAFARENGINLLDVDRLLDLIGKRTPEQQRELLAVALEGDYWRPTCVNCGGKLIERTPRAGGQAFWGCPSYPRCKTTMPMRTR